jgi:hypothetical protein
MSRNRKPTAIRGFQRGRKIVIIHDGTKLSWPRALEEAAKLDGLLTSGLPRSQEKEIIQAMLQRAKAEESEPC